MRKGEVYYYHYPAGNKALGLYFKPTLFVETRHCRIELDLLRDTLYSFNVTLFITHTKDPRPNKEKWQSGPK